MKRGKQIFTRDPDLDRPRVPLSLSSRLDISGTIYPSIDYSAEGNLVKERLIRRLGGMSRQLRRI